MPLPMELTTGGSDVGCAVLTAPPRSLRAYLRSDLGRRSLRYVAMSGVAVVVSQVVLFVTYGLFKWGELAAQTAAVVVSTIPAYFMSRMWVWQKGGKSHLWKEVVPFWGISFAQFLISLVGVHFGQGVVKRLTDSHQLRTFGLLFISLGLYGVMWVGKFVLLNKVLFAHREPATA
jgi:putative flippase GtrA